MLEIFYHTNMWKTWWEYFWTFVEEALQGDHTEQPIPIETPKPIPMPTKADKLYSYSKSEIGAHLSLNNAVPWMVGCAEAVSWLLKHFGTTGIPTTGFEGTATLAAFLSHNTQFSEIYTYTPGAIMVAATGTGNGKIRGHTGVCGYNSIMSNNSETGKWDTQWDQKRWVAYYENFGGFKTRYFLPV